MVLDKYVALTLVAASATAIAGCSDGTRSDVSEGEHTESSAQRLATTSSEYHLAPSTDPDVTGDRNTELWARVYRPATLAANKPYPLLIFLHGNHSTCGLGENPRVDMGSHSLDYNLDGGCPDPYKVVPNHEGYQYIADDLASSGYIVVSINTNMGIQGMIGVPGDPDMILARGRMVLKHLAILSQWNGGTDAGAPAPPSTLGVDLTGHLDFSHVGLFGHSRGGEGVRAAYSLYTTDKNWQKKIGPVHFDGIFEIGPTDSKLKLYATNVPWAVLLPMCDGDVKTQLGKLPFDRMSMDAEEETTPSFKSTLAVWGTNHNYYNTEWQTTDSFGCVGDGNVAKFQEPPHEKAPVDGVTGSADQQQLGKAFAGAFFRGNVGPSRDLTQNDLFKPSKPLPSSITAITRVDRGFLPAMSMTTYPPFGSLIATGTTVATGMTTDVSNVTMSYDQVPEHESGLRAFHVNWAVNTGATYFQVNFAAANTGVPLGGYATLDFRVDRADDPSNPSTATDFTMQLVAADGTLSPAAPKISSYLSLTGPVGLKREVGASMLHSVLQTASIPLVAFMATQPAGYRGVRFTFDHSTSGSIYLTGFRFSKSTSGGGGTGSAMAPVGGAAGTVAEATQPSASQLSAVSKLQTIAPRFSWQTAGYTPSAGRLVSFGRAKSNPRVARRVAEGPTAARDTIAIEVESETPFPIVDDQIVMHVGDLELYPSELSDPTNVYRLVFTLSPEEQRLLQGGEEIAVTCAGMVWRLGNVTRAHLAR